MITEFEGSINISDNPKYHTSWRFIKRSAISLTLTDRQRDTQTYIHKYSGSCGLSTDFRRRSRSMIIDDIIQLTSDCFQLLNLIAVNKINTTEACDVPKKSSSDLKCAVQLHFIQSFSFQVAAQPSIFLIPTFPDMYYMCDLFTINCNSVYII